jgi:hypothetical protein
MSEVKKILGQAAPAATTETDLYVVPDAKGAVVSFISVCNRNASAGTYRISVSYSGGATANKDYTHYDEAIAAKTHARIDMGVTLSNLDEIRVYASNADMSFNCFGAEFDQVNVYIEEPL